MLPEARETLSELARHITNPGEEDPDFRKRNPSTFTVDARLALTFSVATEAPLSHGMTPWLFLGPYYTARRHEDAHDFLMSVLTFEQCPSLYSQLQGRLQSYMECSHCGPSSQQCMTGSHEDFTSLSLHLPETHTCDQKLSTEELLSAFLSPERMPEGTRLNDKVWSCAHCEGSSRPTRTFTFESLPATFIVHFKRWTTRKEGTEYRADMLRHAIEPSHTIHLNDVYYSLVACVYYMGNASIGHYVTVAKHDGQWWLYDDVCRKKCDAPKAELQHNGHFMSYICVYEQS